MFEQFRWREILKELKTIDKVEFVLKTKKDRKPIGHAKLEKIAKKHKIPNLDGAFNRAMGNAVKHGECPVRGRGFVLEDDVFMVVLQDSGSGFDYESMISKLKAGEKYFHNHGKGGRTYANNPHSMVSWEDQGRTIAILYNY